MTAPLNRRREIHKTNVLLGNHQQWSASRLRLWKIREHLVEFCNNTSIPGVKYLTELHRPLHERALWLLGITVSIAVCTILVQQTWHRWTTSPVIVTMDERLRPIWDIPFPAVTICPMAKIDLSMFNLTEALKGNPTGHEKQILGDLTLQCYSPVKTNTTMRNNDAIEAIEKFSVPSNCTIILVKFRGKVREGVFKPLLTESGLCYTFNMLPNEELFAKDSFFSSKEYLKYANVTVQWSLTEGYHSSSGVLAYPYRALGAGKAAGLNVILVTDKNNLEHYCTESLEGYEVMLHNPSEVPRVREQSFLVPLRSAVHVPVSPAELATAEGLRARYSAQQRQCFFPDERRLRFFRRYTRNNCELECIANITLGYCGCVAFYMPRTEDTPICSGDKQECLASARLLFQLSESGLEYDGDSEAIHNATHQEQGGGSCGCVPSCTSISYLTERSRAAADFTKHRVVLEKYKKEDIATWHMAELVIYFKETHFIPTRRMELYGTANFIANCGGVFGLCLGMSVLSVMEILYWLLVRPFWNPRRVAPARNSRLSSLRFPKANEDRRNKIFYIY